MTDAIRRPAPELIVALDVDGMSEALAFADALGDSVRWVKIGKQLFTRFGPQAVQALKARGYRVFLDLKYHDIPNTVAQAVRAAAAIGADLTNVHAGGGPAMLRAAAAAACDGGIALVAVTVLTSMDAAELAATGIAEPPEAQVLRLAALSQTCGVPGVVCSPLEIEAIRKACGPDFLLVVPGIRPATSAANDQKRIMTPRQAAAAGATYVVVGRPITHAANPAAAARAIQAELADDR